MKILGLGILIFIFSIIILNSIAFLFHGGVSIAWTILSLIVSLLVTYFLTKRAGYKRPYLWVCALVAIFAATIFIGSVTTDLSYDGNNYHKYAIGELSNGWNPLYEDIESTWSNTYPKASWVFAASIYQLTGNIESGKSINLLVMSLTFLFAFAYLRYRLNLHKSILLASLLGASPVITMQLFSNYVDGIMGGLLVTLSIVFNALVDKKVKIKKIYLYAAIVMLITIIGNLKFTGLVYAGVIALVYLAFIVFARNWKTVRNLVVAGVVSLVLAIGLVGAPTYIKNTAVYGHPLYPLMGKGAVDIMTSNQPPSYAQKNRIHKFLESNFGETDNIGSFWGWTEDKPDTRLKIPFTFSLRELRMLASGSPDIRQAGYGVWFGGILLLSTIAAVFLLVKFRRKLKKSSVYLAVLPLVPIVITILLFEESWWARYIPHLIIFPIIVLAVLYITKVRILPHLLSFAILFNTILLLSLTLFNQIAVAKEINHNIRTLIPCTASTQELIVTDINGIFRGSTYNLRDWCENVHFKYRNLKESDGPYAEVWNGIYTKQSE